VTGRVYRRAASSIGGAGGHTIEDEGTPLTARAALNFVGAGVTVTDDSGNDATVVTINGANTATALSDGSSISITGVKHTLTTTQSAITFSDSWVGDFTTISVTFTQTSAVWTFPAGALCVVDGVASGDNTATVTGTSGDKIVLSIWDVDGTTYHVITKNFGQ
jgi:hypothetical protein